MFKNTSFLFKTAPVLLLSTLLLAGCAKKYTPHAFQETQNHVVSKDNVSVSAMPLKEDLCKHYFSRKIVKKGYQPILLTIKNNNDHCYTLDARDINLNLTPRSSVVRDLTQADFTSWGFAGLLLFPLLFLIPTFYSAAKAQKANKKLDRDFLRRTIDTNSQMLIYPQAVIKKVMFVLPEHYRNNFALTLKNQKTQEPLPFEITL